MGQSFHIISSFSFDDFCLLGIIITMNNYYCLLLVKKVLYSVLKEQTLDDIGLHAALCEVEAIMNE